MQLSSRRSPYIIEALYALSERDPHFFCDALNSGKTKACIVEEE